MSSSATAYHSKRSERALDTRPVSFNNSSVGPAYDSGSRSGSYRSGAGYIHSKVNPVQQNRWADAKGNAVATSWGGAPAFSHLPPPPPLPSGPWQLPQPIPSMYYPPDRVMVKPSMPAMTATQSYPSHPGVSRFQDPNINPENSAANWRRGRGADPHPLKTTPPPTTLATAVAAAGINRPPTAAHQHPHHQQQQQQPSLDFGASEDHELRELAGHIGGSGAIDVADAVAAGATVPRHNRNAGGGHQRRGDPPRVEHRCDRKVSPGGVNTPRLKAFPSTRGSDPVCITEDQRSPPAAHLHRSVAKSVPSHEASVDADNVSCGSETPPPEPVPKHFTAAHLKAVRQAVRQELHLAYPAVQVPEEMLNRGDTEERRRRLGQRRKQISYGKETEGYLKYTKVIPRPADREYHNPLHTVTPRPEFDCSKRKFDRVLNAWRRQLHQWDECDLDNMESRFLPLGTATLQDLGLCSPVACSTPLQPPATGMMHSIANVAAMENDESPDRLDCRPMASPMQTRSPIFTGHSPTSGFYASPSLSVQINSGRAASASACTPSRPHGPEGPQVDESFFMNMNSNSSCIASPFHHGGPTGGAGGSGNTHHPSHLGRPSSHHNGAGGSAAAMYCTGLTPAHRPSSRGGKAHHISSILGREYDLMTPSAPASPSGPPHAMSGGSPYRLGEPWMPTHSLPSYHHHHYHHHHHNTTTVNTEVAATELALIPSSTPSGSGLPPSPYGYRIQSPIQTQTQAGHPPHPGVTTTPLTHQRYNAAPPHRAGPHDGVATTVTVTVHTAAGSSSRLNSSHAASQGSGGLVTSTQKNASGQPGAAGARVSSPNAMLWSSTSATPPQRTRP